MSSAVVSYRQRIREERGCRMGRRKLLLAEGNEEFAQALADALQEDYVIRLCRDGQTACRLMDIFQPDIVVLDLMLPGLDGVSLLQWMTDTGLCPAVLATTWYCSAYMAQTLERFGVGYVLVKPCDLRATVVRIGDLTTRITRPIPQRPDPEVLVSNMLRELSFSTKLKGFRYLPEAVLMLADDPDQSITKELYAALAQRHNTHHKSVERCIRTAIEKAWARRDDAVWQAYFAAGGEQLRERPSNGVLLTCLVQRLLEQTGSVEQKNACD